MKDLSKSLKVAKELNVIVKFVGDKPLDDEGLINPFDPGLWQSAGSWPGHGRTIFINPEVASNYTVLHEIGHVINGMMCCREHCEYAAHGAAMALAKAYKIKLHKYDKYSVDCYAGRSARKSCGAIEIHKKGFSDYGEYLESKKNDRNKKRA